MDIILLSPHHQLAINTPSSCLSLTEHLVLHRAVGVIQVQEELLEEELQMGSAELRVVVFGQAGQPQPEGLKGDAAHILAAVIQTLQQLCGEKTPTCKTLIRRIRIQKFFCGFCCWVVIFKVEWSVFL